MNELQTNIERFWKSAEIIYKEEDYTSATMLYFKCLFVILDKIIFLKERKTPKDHTERFEILKKSFPKYYEILDKIYVIYRDTYSISIEKEKCEEVKKYVRNIAQEQRIQL